MFHLHEPVCIDGREKLQLLVLVRPDAQVYHVDFDLMDLGVLLQEPADDYFQVPVLSAFRGAGIGEIHRILNHVQNDLFEAIPVGFDPSALLEILVGDVNMDFLLLQLLVENLQDLVHARDHIEPLYLFYELFIFNGIAERCVVEQVLDETIQKLDLLVNGLLRLGYVIFNRA